MLTLCHFAVFLLACASFLNVTAIAVDRLLALSLHLRYQELVTSKRVTALVCLWLTSGVAAVIYLHSRSNIVTTIFQFIGLFLTTVVYVRIYKVVIYHHEQIQSQLQLQNGEASDMLREKKSVLAALFVCVVFIVCYLLYLCSVMHQSIETPAPRPPGHSGGVTGTWPWKYVFATLHFPRGTGTVTSQICEDFSRGL